MATPRRKPRVYVAALSSELDRAAAAMKVARHMGYQVTFDWAANIRRAGSANQVSARVARSAAKRSIEGAASADIFVLLYPKNGKPLKGALVELGSHLAKARKPLVVISGIPKDLGEENSIFFSHAIASPHDDATFVFMRGFAESFKRRR